MDGSSNDTARQLVSTRQYVARVVNGFERLIEAAENADEGLHTQLPPQDLVDELAYFRVWAGTTGAHRTGRTSLDHKLRLASHIHDKVTAGLRGLEEALCEGLELVENGGASRSSSPSSDSSTYSFSDDETIPTTTALQDVFQNIQRRIKALTRLSVIFRQPASRDLTAKYSSLSLQYFENWDLRHVEEKVAIMAMRERKEIPEFEDEIGGITEKLPMFCSKELISRLAKANTERRKLFLYLNHHHIKISKGIDGPLPVAPRTIKGSQADRNTVGGSSRKTGKTGTTNWTHDDNAEVAMSESGLTETSFAASVVHDNDDVVGLDNDQQRRLQIPPPPEPLGDRSFNCPICHFLINPTNTREWNRHVMRDIRPYICTFENCSSGLRLFETRRSWSSHEKQYHRREWQCGTCDKIYWDRDEFRAHWDTCRSGKDQILPEHAIDLCERATLSNQYCSICAKQCSSRSLASHLGRHMEELALFSIPSWDNADGDASDDGRSDTDKLANLNVSADSSDADLEGSSDKVNPKDGSSVLGSELQTIVEGKTEDQGSVRMYPLLFNQWKHNLSRTKPLGQAVASWLDNEEQVDELPEQGPNQGSTSVGVTAAQTPNETGVPERQDHIHVKIAHRMEMMQGRSSETQEGVENSEPLLKSPSSDGQSVPLIEITVSDGQGQPHNHRSSTGQTAETAKQLLQAHGIDPAQAFTTQKFEDFANQSLARERSIELYAQAIAQGIAQAKKPREGTNDGESHTSQDNPMHSMLLQRQDKMLIESMLSGQQKDRLEYPTMSQTSERISTIITHEVDVFLEEHNLMTTLRRTKTAPLVHAVATATDSSQHPAAVISDDEAGDESDGKRMDFKCSLCPKRFTRAYNLRSHLRTHTNERPFICSVCGKAFAREGDRKRHESLHSGEKKFVCRGYLNDGSFWGCGRRFARGDALATHYNSEAGRVCIRPVFDEENDLLGDQSARILPAAILQQYPALAGLTFSVSATANGPMSAELSSFKAAEYQHQVNESLDGFDQAENDQLQPPVRTAAHRPVIRATGARRRGISRTTQSTNKTPYNLMPLASTFEPDIPNYITRWPDIPTEIQDKTMMIQKSTEDLPHLHELHNSSHGNTALQDYQMQLLLEQQNKKRLLLARQAQGEIHTETAEEGPESDEIDHEASTSSRENISGQRSPVWYCETCGFGPLSSDSCSKCDWYLGKPDTRNVVTTHLPSDIAEKGLLSSAAGSTSQLGELQTDNMPRSVGEDESIHPDDLPHHDEKTEGILTFTDTDVSAEQPKSPIDLLAENIARAVVTKQPHDAATNHLSTDGLPHPSYFFEAGERISGKRLAIPDIGPDLSAEPGMSIDGFAKKPANEPPESYNSRDDSEVIHTKQKSESASEIYHCLEVDDARLQKVAARNVPTRNRDVGERNSCLRASPQDEEGRSDVHEYAERISPQEHIADTPAEGSGFSQPLCLSFDKLAGKIADEVITTPKERNVNSLAGKFSEEVRERKLALDRTDTHDLERPLPSNPSLKYPKHDRVNPTPHGSPERPLWTKFAGNILSKRAVQRMGYSFEEQGDAIIIHRTLSEDEIDRVMNLSDQIRNG